MQLLTRLAISVVVVAIAGVAAAAVPDPDNRGQAIGTIRSIDRTHQMVTMGNGLRLRAADPQMLEELQEGELVKLEFVHERDGWLIRSIEAAEAGGAPSDTDAE
jgi:hypothetical protein